jgi:PAS domain S-box-containing protein
MDHSNRVRKITLLLSGALPVFVGGFVLLGWAFDITAFKSPLPGGVAMQANTALGFMLAGMALLASSLPASVLPRRLAWFGALLSGLIGLLVLGESLFDLNPGLAQWLFAQPTHTLDISPPDPMAPDTAVCFVLLAAGLTFASGARKTTIRFWFTTIIGSLIMAVALTALLSYCAETIGAFGLWDLTLMSSLPATLFVLLSMAVILSAWPEDISPWSLTGKTAFVFALWSIILSLSLTWNLHQQGHHLLESAMVAAQANINKDIGFRKWATSHGGVYVPPTEHTPPNPYLTVPHRDVITTTGIPLTLMNPAYMLREMQQKFGDEYGTRSRITSLKPLNPANAPDVWQAKALSNFAQGGKELRGIQYLNNQPHLRLMLPIFVESGCLKCHGQQGYNLGDIRGGIDTSIPLAPFLTRARESSTELVLSHGAIWLLGITGLLLFYRREHALDTENQKSAAALRTSEERYSLLVNSIPEVFWMVSADYQQVLYISPAYEQIWGRSCQSLLENPSDWQTAVVKEDLPGVIAVINGIGKNTGGQLDFPEYRILRPDGTLRWIKAKAVPLKDETGRIVHVAGLCEDITEHKRAEEEKQKLESQLRQAQKMEAIGTLAGGIAHDFNNILSIIFGYNQLAMVEKDPENRRRHLEELNKGAERAKELVGQILAFSRKGEQQKQPLQASLIVKEALKMLRSSIPTTIEIRPNIVSQALVLADPTQIHQVVMNLCANAYHAMRETGGILAVSLEEVRIAGEDYGYADLAPGNYLKLEVSDTGCGIDAKTQEKIFEPYFTTKKPGEGTGLGLAVVHGIVKSHHGHITVYSEPGKGTSFHVYLPLTEQLAVAKPDTTAPKELRGKGERILFVDDEKQIREVVAAILTKNGYQVTPCADGAQALAEFEKEPERFDLVITDMTMPSMTGAELTQKILALRPQTPIILCTGQSELINREKALAMGIRAYLHKPVLMETLLGEARKALEKNSGTPSS